VKRHWRNLYLDVEEKLFQYLGSEGSDGCLRYKKLHEKALFFAAELGVAEEFKGLQNWINKVVSKWKDQKSGNSEGGSSYDSD
jgi:hypothetical protein